MANAKTKRDKTSEPPLDRRIAAGNATRQRILKAAVAIAGATGFPSLTIGTLAEAAGLSKSSLFTHFPTRDDLVIATLEAAYDEFDREVLDACRESPPRDTMRVFLRRYVAYLNDRPKSHACIITSSAFEFDGANSRLRKKVVELIDRRRSDMRKLMERAREAGYLPGTEGDFEQQLFDAESLMVGFAYRYQLNPNSQLFDRLIAGIRRVFPDAPPPSRGSRKKLRAVR